MHPPPRRRSQQWRWPVPVGYGLGVLLVGLSLFGGTVRHARPEPGAIEQIIRTRFPAVASRLRSDVTLTSATATIAGNQVAGFRIVAPVAVAGIIATGPMTPARSGHTATLLPTGLVLVAGGDGGGASTALYDPTTGTFFSAFGATMATARADHTATLLQNGQVLVAGGVGGGSTAELFNSTTSTFTVTDQMTTPRAGHTATLLPNGRVLVAGGDTGFGTTRAADVYEPATGRFSGTSQMATARKCHTATLLQNGQVLVVGGAGGGATAELYNPVTGSFTATGSMKAARECHTATLLPTGLVLVAGGAGGGATAELYDPGTGAFSYTGGSMAAAREAHTATLLPNGRVLLAGGRNGGTPDLSVELYDPGTNGFFFTDSMATARASHTATLLPNGRVLVAGGFDGLARVGTAELYDSLTPSVGSGGTMTTPRFWHTATPLPTLRFVGPVFPGEALLAGGSPGPGLITETAETYNRPAFFQTGSMATRRFLHTATLLPTGKILIAGGFTPTGGADTAELYNPLTGAFTPAGTMRSRRFGHSATLLADGTVLLAGGGTAPGVATDTAEIYDPGARTFTLTAGVMATPRFAHTATLLPFGQVLVAGGFTGAATTASTDLYDPTTRTFSAGPPMTARRQSHTATLLSGATVLLAGGVDGNTVLNSTDLYAGSFIAGPSMNASHFNHSATLLPTGLVLIAGGFAVAGETGITELYDPAPHSFAPPPLPGLLTPVQNHAATTLETGQVLITGGVSSNTGIGGAQLYDTGLGFPDARRPVILTAPTTLGQPGALALIGAGFRGGSEASGGASQNSSTGFPVVQLRRLDNEQMVTVVPGSWSDTAFTSVSLDGLPVGHYRLTVTSNGVPSLARMLRLVRRRPSVDFRDVPVGHFARSWIQSLVGWGVTAGCASAPPLYCPDAPVTREQMAAFLLKAREWPGFVPEACTTPTFGDVACGSGFAPWIQALVAEGVTAGCSSAPLLYCPQSAVTREQMAVFLLKALFGSGFVPPPCTVPPFADVPCTSPFAPWIRSLVNLGITAGCSVSQYCPGNPVTRGQMAVFLVKTFDLPL